MSKKLSLIPIFFIVLFFSNPKVYAQWRYPVIKGYGAEVNLPHAAVKPDKNIHYKIVFNIEVDKNKSDVNRGLTHLARLINLYAAEGIPPQKIKLVAVMTGPATYVALNDKTYQQEFGKKNPNTYLLKELRNKGHVKLFVCGQSITGMGFNRTNINPSVTLALSALSVVPTYEMKGYALMDF